MKTYYVLLHVVHEEEFIVEADTPEDAKYKASVMASQSDVIDVSCETIEEVAE